MILSLLSFEAEVWKWSGEKSSWHFATLPSKFYQDIKLNCPAGKGFGSVKVVARIGQIQWKTSIFASKQHKSYILPIKADVRKRCNIESGSFCKIHIELEPKFL